MFVYHRYLMWSLLHGCSVQQLVRQHFTLWNKADILKFLQPTFYIHLVVDLFLSVMHYPEKCFKIINHISTIHFQNHQHEIDLISQWKPKRNQVCGQFHATNHNCKFYDKHNKSFRNKLFEIKRQIAWTLYTLLPLTNISSSYFLVDSFIYIKFTSTQRLQVFHFH